MKGARALMLLLEWRLRRLSLYSWLLLALFVSSLLLLLLTVFVTIAIDRSRSELDQRNQQLATLKPAKATFTTLNAAAIPNNIFMTSDKLPALSRLLFESARDTNVTLSRTEFQQVKAVGERPASIQVIVVAQGSYTNIRRYVQTTLFRAPVAALREIHYSRANENETAVDVRFLLSIQLADLRSGA